MSANKICRVADPVHDYVELTPIEVKILERPVTQRIRNIHQTGLAHMVYPELKTSRLAHSLGTMHLASEFLAACLKNMKSEDRVRFESGADRALRDLRDPSGMWSGTRARQVVSGDDTLLAHHFASDSAQDSARDTIRVLEQALRLAALFHDLGHLPFSHDFEFAVSDLWRDSTSEFRLPEEVDPAEPLHEQIGHQLARFVLADIAENDADLLALFGCAYRILEAPSPLHLLATELSDSVSSSDADQIWSWLHSLIDGEVDADRCDYLLRDGRNFGFSFASYDLHRLLDHMTARWDPVLQLIIKSRGMSALESFLLARFRSYQYGVFHHKVLQFGQALQHCVRIMLDKPTDEIAIFVDDLKAVLSWSPAEQERDEWIALLDRFRSYDDSWWTTQMRSYDPDSRDRPWFELILWRAQGPKSLWKRPEQFPIELPIINQAMLHGMLFTRSFEVVQAIDNARSELRAENVLLAVPKFQPWKTTTNSAMPEEFESSLMVEYDRMTDRDENETGQPLVLGTLVPASEMSPLIRSLWTMWMHSVQIWAFSSGEPVQWSPRDVAEKVLAAAGAVQEHDIGETTS